MQPTLVIIPTYNERENAPHIMKEVLAASEALDILMVDDSSPDGTADVIREFAKTNPRIHLLVRAKKDGLGKAYIAGFEWGLERKYDNFVQMDADLSHSPKDVPRIIEALKSSDAVIGSRYTSGGGTSGWSRIRECISRSGNLYARTILSVRFNDMTGGFNGWKRATLEKIDLRTIESRGYAFQVEMKYRAYRKGLKIQEIPITFLERLHGKSKMTYNIVTEAALKVLKLRTQL